MEVLSFFSSDKNIVNYFTDFMSKYSRLKLGDQDNDTLFYLNPKTEKNELYVHFILNDIEYEFTYNYSDEESKLIRSLFGSRVIFSFDIQYRDENVLKELLKAFKHYMEERALLENDLLFISHPHEGILDLVNV